MIMFLLLGHITLAVLSLLLAGGVITSTRKQKLETAYSRTKKMWYGTLATTISGVVLTIVQGSSIGRLCITLLVFLVVIVIAHFYQRTVRQMVLRFSDEGSSAKHDQV
jgi:hypothetical protein